MFTKMYGVEETRIIFSMENVLSSFYLSLLFCTPSFLLFVSLNQVLISVYNFEWNETNRKFDHKFPNQETTWTHANCNHKSGTLKWKKLLNIKKMLAVCIQLLIYMRQKHVIIVSKARSKELSFQNIPVFLFVLFWFLLLLLMHFSAFHSDQQFIWAQGSNVIYWWKMSSEIRLFHFKSLKFYCGHLTNGFVNNRIVLLRVITMKIKKFTYEYDKYW